jgi:hypothetical protein
MTPTDDRKALPVDADEAEFDIARQLLMLRQALLRDQQSMIVLCDVIAKLQSRVATLEKRS